MTKADIVNEIAKKTGFQKSQVSDTLDAFLVISKNTMASGENIYIRGFGTFAVRKRAKKTGRNISKNVAVVIPEHYVPSFKPSKDFVTQVKENVKSLKK